MSCNKITQNIVLDCSKIPRLGIKPKIWVANISDISYTSVEENEVKTLFVPQGFYKIEGVKGAFDVVAEKVEISHSHEMYKHSITMTIHDPAGALEKAEALVVVYQDQHGDYYALGPECGVWKESQSQASSENNAMKIYTYSSRAGIEERYSSYKLNLIWAFESPLEMLEYKFTGISVTNKTISSSEFMILVPATSGAETTSYRTKNFVVTGTQAFYLYYNGDAGYQIT
jgi:hypothetical protein